MNVASTKLHYVVKILPYSLLFFYLCTILESGVVFFLKNPTTLCSGKCQLSQSTIIFEKHCFAV